MAKKKKKDRMISSADLAKANARHDAAISPSDNKFAKQTNNSFYRHAEKEDLRSSLGTGWSKRYSGSGPHYWGAEEERELKRDLERERVLGLGRDRKQGLEQEQKQAQKQAQELEQERARELKRERDRKRVRDQKRLRDQARELQQNKDLNQGE
jgi:hypothetical protein